MNRVLAKGDLMKLSELVQVDHENDIDYFAYIVCLIFLRVYEEAPLGLSAVDEYLKYFNWLKISGLEFSSLLDFAIIKWYEKEIRACEDIEEILQWLNHSTQLQVLYNLNIDSITNSAFSSVIQYIWKQMSLASSLNNIEFTCNYLQNVRIFQSFKVIDNQVISLIFNNIYQSLNIQYDIEGTQKIFGKFVISNLDNAFRVVNELKGMELCENDLKAFERLIKKIFVKSVEKLIFAAGDKNLHALEDFSGLNYKSEIFFGSTEQFEIIVYLAQHPGVGNLVVKEYKAKKNVVDLSIHYQEIEILQKLSSLASEDNCFPLFFGYFSYGNSLCLLTEYYESNLMSLISEYKSQNIPITESLILCTTKKLLNSFTIMKALKIFHSSVKPHILLVTPQFDLKITDFSAPGIKMQINPIWHTSEYTIQGTDGYEAPEIYQYLNMNKKEYNKGKADVFSLGLTILQMSIQENFSDLNKPENHPLLIQKLNLVTVPWLKTLLSNMLHLNPNTRKSFEYLSLSTPSN